MTLEVLSDFDLVKQTNAGHAEAFSVLVKRHRQAIMSLSMRYVRDQFWAEDIVQDSFLKAYEKLSTFQFKSAFKSWLYRIAINTAKNALRGRKHMVGIADVVIRVDDECEATLIDKDLIEQAQGHIKKLPHKQRQALKLRVFNDLSFKDVAKKMDCPYDTAKANYRHGLLKLKEKMIIAW